MELQYYVPASLADFIQGGAGDGLTDREKETGRTWRDRIGADTRDQEAVMVEIFIYPIRKRIQDQDHIKIGVFCF